MPEGRVSDNDLRFARQQMLFGSTGEPHRTKWLLIIEELIQRRAEDRKGADDAA